MNHALPTLAAALTLAATAASAAPDSARQFLTDAMKGDNSEMMLGRLGAEKGASQGVRDFGRMLADDHGKAKVEAVRVAGRLGVPKTDAATPEAENERVKLQGLSGGAFDREYARYMVQDHTKDIAKFKQAESLAGPAGALAKSTLPTLQKHLATARKLAG